jgi:hypothetical protein
MLNLHRNPLLNPAAPSVAGIESELRRLPHLAGDRKTSRKIVRAVCRDARQIKTAAEAIGKLPGPDEALHLVVSGRFALWHVVPAVLELAGVPIAELRIATLGFSRKNIEALCRLIDGGQIGRAWLLCSHYFKGTSAEVYNFAADEIAKRPTSAAFYSIRTHAKVLTIRLTDGRTLTVESSANLRSCKNIEQMTVIGSQNVYTFHVGWIDELFTAGGK